MDDTGFIDQSKNLALTRGSGSSRSAVSEEGHVPTHIVTGSLSLPPSMTKRLGDSHGQWESSEGGEGHRSHPGGPCGRKRGG